MLLPPVTDPAQCAQLRQDPEWVARVCAHFEAQLQLSGPGVVYPTGSGVSARFGDTVFKLFFPFQRRQAEREAALHELLAEQLSLETPRLVERGDDSGWPWLLTAAVTGSDLGQTWSVLALADRVALGRQIGRAMAELHAQRPPGDLAVTWPLWARVQIAGAIDRHRRGGCPEALLKQISEYLETTDLSVGARGIGLVHTAVRPEHLVVAKQGEDWVLTGLIGFATAMVAPVDYEFGPVGIDLGRGDPEVLGAILTAYGIDPAESDLRQRLFGMALVHLDSNLGEWLRQHPDAPSRHLHDLADHWFAAV